MNVPEFDSEKFQRDIDSWTKGDLGPIWREWLEMNASMLQEIQELRARVEQLERERS